MTKYILIGGHIYGAQDNGKSFCEALIENIYTRPVRILDCLFARDKDVWKQRFKDDCDFFSRNISDVKVNLADPENFIEQIKNSDIIFFQGGIPDKLISELNNAGDWVKEIDSKIIAGSSGGADAICKYYGVGKTMRIGEGLGLLPIKFIPHWKSKDYAQNTDIDWDELLDKLEKYGEDTEVVTLGDGEFKIIITES